MFLDKNNKDGLMEIFSMKTPWGIFLKKPWVGNICFTRVICIKLAAVRPTPASVIIVTIKSDDLTLLPELWEGEGLVRDLDPLIPTPSTPSTKLKK